VEALAALLFFAAVALSVVAVFVAILRQACPHCRARVPRGASVCSKCGRDL
jgi:predicted amidophosphoribosyltransferase